MHESILISVIIPVYNAEKYIKRCVCSIQDNTYKNIEIICVDDGSTDRSLELLREMQNKDDRILVISQENQGVSAARNTGLKAARGGWIGFVDADDWVHRDYLEILISSVQGVDIINCGFVACKDRQEDIPQKEINRTIIPAEIGYQNYAVKSYVWGKLFRKEIIDNLRFPENVKLAEDKIFVLQAIGNAEKIMVIDNRLYYYFLHSDSTSHAACYNMLPAGQELLGIAKETNNKHILYNAYTAFLAHRYLYMFNKDFKKIDKGVKSYLKECRKLARKIMPLKEQILLNTFAVCPWLYRCWRIAKDHTLIEWEREQRRQKMNRMRG